MDSDSGGSSNAASNSNTVTNDIQKPNLQQKINRYRVNDNGPFIVLIQSKNIEKGLSKIHPIKLGRSLKRAKIEEVHKIVRKGTNRLGIEFLTAKGANDFLKSNFCINENLEAAIPVNLVSCKGVIKGIPVDISVEDFVNTVESEVKVISARRINFRKRNDEGQIEYSPTHSLIVTFEGKKLPKQKRTQNMIVSNRYVQEKEDFPQLPKHDSIKENVIEVQERREWNNRTAYRRTPLYSQTVRTPKRKTQQDLSPPLDKKVVKEAIFPSSARSVSSPTPMYSFLERNRQEKEIEENQNLVQLSIGLSDWVGQIISQTTLFKSQGERSQQRMLKEMQDILEDVEMTEASGESLREDDQNDFEWQQND
ncbi:unnamed protein product [Ceutorhynchus assimilis]|uniref:Uncharacterized protein n=1 Tax=Ceutorhynchus assimilis TaxID=467358 RepID=A0A9N9MBI7_9CUCU|nr:unnamed protein product [Ceutorhynchus assimilis]